MKNLKKTTSLLLVLMLLALTACGGSVENQLVGTWSREGNTGTAFVLYSDGSCEIAGEYGTGKWAIVNDNQLKLTNYYGESETATIEKISDKEMTLSGTTFVKTK